MDNRRFNKLMSESDFVLLKKGKQQGFHKAYLLYADLVYSLCFHLTGNEKSSSALLQATFDKVLKKRANIHTPDTFAYWVRKCTINECMKYLRQQRPDDILFNNFLHSFKEAKNSYAKTQSNISNTLNVQSLVVDPNVYPHTVEGSTHNTITSGIDNKRNRLLHNRALKKVRCFFEKTRKS